MAIENLQRKAFDTAVFLIIIVAYLLLVNALNVAQSAKQVLYLLTFIFIAAWLFYIIRI
jgi:hypothetical protein